METICLHRKKTLKKNCKSFNKKQMKFCDKIIAFTHLRANVIQVHQLVTYLATAHQALTDMQRLKDESERLKLEKCLLEKEKNDVLQEKDELVVQNNSLQKDLRAKKSKVHKLETSPTKV